MNEMFHFTKGDKVFLVWPVKTPYIKLDGDFYEVMGVMPSHIQVNGSNLWIPKWHFIKVMKEYVKPLEKPITEKSALEEFNDKYTIKWVSNSAHGYGSAERWQIYSKN